VCRPNEDECFEPIQAFVQFSRNGIARADFPFIEPHIHTGKRHVRSDGTRNFFIRFVVAQKATHWRLERINPLPQ
jgi:hypothetical protein